MCKRKSWRKIRNPWKKIKDKCYVLENEKEAAQNEQYQFHTDLPPQPYQGNPKAPIWILMLNPCYSEDDEKYYGGDTDRCTAILNQLKFKKSGEHWHYVLDNAKNNFSRKWFEDHFFNKDMGITADNVDDKIFILQAVGYASEKFNGNLNTMVKSFPHMVYTQKLARWGLANGKKIVIARCKDYWQNVLNIEIKSENIQKNVYFLCSYLNLSFSSGNIISYEKYKCGWKSKKEYCMFKQESAQELKNIIENQ